MTKIAFYGPFMKGLKLNKELGESKHIGSYTTEPEFSMFKLKSDEPAITLDGRTSIVMDVYEVKPSIIKQVINAQKGCISKKDLDKNTFNRKIIQTPFGRTLVYVYNKNTSKLKKINLWRLERTFIKNRN